MATFSSVKFYRPILHNLKCGSRGKNEKKSQLLNTCLNEHFEI